MPKKFNYKYIINKTSTAKEKTEALKDIKNIPNINLCFEFTLPEENRTVLSVANTSWISMLNTEIHNPNIFYINDINELKTYYDLTGSLLDYSTKD